MRLGPHVGHKTLKKTTSQTQQTKTQKKGCPIAKSGRSGGPYYYRKQPSVQGYENRKHAITASAVEDIYMYMYMYVFYDFYLS